MFRRWFDSEPRVFAIGLFALAVVLRLGLSLLLRDMSAGPPPSASGDDRDFNEIALALARGEGYALNGKPTSFRAPGFPLFLAAFYAPLGANFTLMRLVFIVLGAATCVLSYLVAREVLAERPARLAGVLVAIYVGHIYVALDFMSENLFIPLLSGTLLLLLRWMRGGGSWMIAACGVLIGYAILVRPFAVLLLPLWVAVLAWRHRENWRSAVGPLLALVLPSAVMLAPWVARNMALHGHFVPFTTNGGSTFYGSNNDLVSSLSRPRLLGYWVATNDLPGRAEIAAQPNEYLHDRKEWELGKQWVGDHLGRLPFLLSMKLVRLGLGLPDFDAGGLGFVLLRAAGYYPFLLCMLIGWSFCFRQQAYWTPPWLIVHATLLATLATTVIFAGLPRFRDANVTIMMIYALIGLQAVAPKLRCALAKRRGLSQIARLRP